MERETAVILLFLFFRCSECLLLSDEDCIDPFSCYPEGGNELGRYGNVTSQAECRAICQRKLKCTYFTYYDENHPTDLQSTCFTFSECEIKNRECKGCFSGPPTCSSCATPSANGGKWYCQKDDKDEESRENQKCFYTCGNELKLKKTCHVGSFNIDEERIVCPCYNKPEGNSVTCSNDELSEEHDYPGETKCTKTCSNDEVHETICENGRWTIDFSRISCSNSNKHSLYLIVGLSVVGGLVLITGVVMVYLLGIKACAKQSQSMNHSFLTISANKEHDRNKVPRYVEGIPKVLEFSQVDGLDDRRYLDQYEQKKTNPAHHYHFIRLPARSQQPKTNQQEERGHPPPRIYQQSRHLYQGRDFRPRVIEQPLSRGPSLSEHQM